MPADEPNAKLRWEDGDLPVSSRFDDPYYSRADGWAESRHVFLDGNGLTERFSSAETFRIAELGFGTGLNVLAAWELWRRVAKPGAVLNVTSFEMFPLAPTEMARAWQPWPQIATLGATLLDHWKDCVATPDGLYLTVIDGDARAALPAWEGQADAWFLDGFAPARNPELWEPDLMRSVFERTAAAGTFATYTAAGHVRRALLESGFQVEKVAGFARKREMLVGKRVSRDRFAP